MRGRRVASTKLSAYLRFAEKSVGQLFVQAESDAGPVNIQIESAVSAIIETTSVLTGINWIVPLSLRTPLDFAGDFSGSRSLIVVVFGLALLGVWRVRRDPGSRWSVTLLVSSFLVPVAILALVSVRVPLFVSRYLMPSLPALILETRLLLVVLGIGASIHQPASKGKKLRLN